MNLDEMALDMARTLLADPGDEMIEVWRRGDEWGWCRMDVGPRAPAAAEIIFQDRVQNQDSEPTDDESAIRQYASDVVLAAQAVVEHQPDPPAPN